MMHELLRREQNACDRFFGGNRSSLIPDTPGRVTREILVYWDSLGLDLHYIPQFDFHETRSVPAWYELPHKQLYQEIASGNIPYSAALLPGRWVLIERFNKPRGSRLWISKQEIGWLGSTARKMIAQAQHATMRNDPIQPALAHMGCSGRTCLSFHDILRLCNDAREIFHVGQAITRLPKFAEYNYLGNLWYPEWRATNTWEWLYDRRGTSERLTTGSGSVGILGWDPEDHWSIRLLFRFLMEL